VTTLRAVMDAGSVLATRGWQQSGWFGARFRLERGLFAGYGRTTPLDSEQAVSGGERIGQLTGDERAVGVLGDPAVVRLRGGKDAFDDTDAMRDSSAHSRRLRSLTPA